MFYVHAAGCGGYRHGMWTAPELCGRPVVAAGLVFYRYPHPQVWLGFACAEHVGQLEVARPITDRDRAVLSGREARRPDPRPDPRPDHGHDHPDRARDETPLATGRAARELLERARRWAAAHPDQTYPAAAAARAATARPAPSPQDAGPLDPTG